MDIKSIGGEFSLINKISNLSLTSGNNLIQGIGDDAAVITTDINHFTLVTTDMLVENSHFKTDWSSPKQIGIKAVESNVSDIAAMGGKSTFMFISLSLKINTTVKWVEELYKGIRKSCYKHNIILAGGDITHGKIQIINITLLGKVLPKNLSLRNQAKPGDFLAISGYIGSSNSGLTTLFKNKIPPYYLLKNHITPKSSLSLMTEINFSINAMIDISDGLFSEIHHLCDKSKIGAIIYEMNIPIHPKTRHMANKRYSPLTGGEDLELLFSFNPNQINFLNKINVNYHIIGKITKSKKNRLLITKSGEKKTISYGFNHFSK